ncbi:MAG: S41 family peptidase [Myxococcota bacterium]|nr:S41 family peptidase [Myxococcota bacterium]
MGLSMKWSRRARRTAHWAVAGVLVLGLGGPVPALAATEAQTQRYEDLALFANILDRVRENYVAPADEHELMQSAMRGLLGELDPHSAFMPKDVYDEMQVDTRGEFDGIGIEINKAQGQYIEIVSPFDGTPAFRIGLKARDLIVSICPTEVPESWAEGETCRTTEVMSLFEAVELMRGKRGTEITLEILREGWLEPHSFTIARDVVRVDSVEGETLTPGFGYLRINEFKERTNDELTRTLAKLHSENPKGLEGLVLDLRDNPGGLLNQAVAVADHWLGAGLIVYTQGRDESSRENYAARPGFLEAPYPMVVLVNEGSASASEIVAGALQDQDRALVMGMRTFGKGSVQTIYPLDGGAGLRLTTALYYTPSGRSIQEVGIEPDVEVHPGSPETSVLYRGVREQDLRGHISHDAASSGLSDGASEAEPAEDASGEEASESDPPADETPADETRADEIPADETRDVLVTRALEVLKSWTYFDRLSNRQVAPAPSVQGNP